MKLNFLAACLLALPLAATAVLSPLYAIAGTTGLGDLSPLEAIASDTLALVTKGDLDAAQKRITDFETAWDADEPRLYPMNKAEWGVIDDAADKAISSLRAETPSVEGAKRSVTGLIDAIQHPSAF